jgi:hypothetical protein
LSKKGKEITEYMAFFMKYGNRVISYRTMKQGAEPLLCYGHGCRTLFGSNMTGEKKSQCPYIQEKMIADLRTVYGKSKLT